jgi:phage-related protein
MKTLALFLATTLTVSPAFGWDIDIDFDEIKKDLKGVTEKVSGAAQDIDIIPDEVKSALSSSDNILTEDTLEHERLVGKEISGRLLGAAPLVKDKKTTTLC